MRRVDVCVGVDGACGEDSEEKDEVWGGDGRGLLITAIKLE